MTDDERPAYYQTETGYGPAYVDTRGDLYMAYFVADVDANHVIHEYVMAATVTDAFAKLLIRASKSGRKLADV